MKKHQRPPHIWGPGTMFDTDARALEHAEVRNLYTEAEAEAQYYHAPPAQKPAPGPRAVPQRALQPIPVQPRPIAAEPKPSALRGLLMIVGIILVVCTAGLLWAALKDMLTTSGIKEPEG